MNEDSWYQINFLSEGYRKCVKEAILDEEFKMGKFDTSVKKYITRLVHQYTWDEHERSVLIQDMYDAAMDERRMV